jgi:uncharacterized RDD family membrane protein YckC
MSLNPPENPYASPAIPVALLGAEQPREIKIASQNRRVLNLILDAIVIQLFVQVGGFAIGFTYGVVKVASGGTFGEQDQQLLQIVGGLFGLTTFVAYYVVMEALFQRTIAKLLTGTIVVNRDGRRPSISQIVGRTFARIIPFEAFSYLRTPPVGWHDSLSGTLVITTK